MHCVSHNRQPQKLQPSLGLVSCWVNHLRLPRVNHLGLPRVNHLRLSGVHHRLHLAGVHHRLQDLGLSRHNQLRLAGLHQGGLARHDRLHAGWHVDALD